MHLIDGPGATIDGHFTAGDPLVGVPATDVTADWCNAVQAELAAAIAAAGLALNKADNTQLASAIAKLAASYVPVGQVSLFYSDVAPEGYLALQGQLFNRADHPELVTHVLSRGLVVPEAGWAASWTLFGAGDGASTMRAPDFRGEMVRIWDAGRGIDVGRGLGSWQADDLRSHVHQLRSQSYQISIDDTPGRVLRGDFGLADDGLMGAVGGSETRPRNVALLACIKA